MPTEGENNIEINPELWRQAPLAMTGSEEDKTQLTNQLAQKSGVSPDKADELLHE